MAVLFAILVVLCIIAFIFSGVSEKIVPKSRPEPVADDGSLPFLIFPVVRDTPSFVPLPVARGSGARPWEHSPPPAEVTVPSAASVSLADTSRADFPEGATIAFRRPADEPMQLLPGRLELLEGENERKEFRLASMLGERARIVLGRAMGPPHRCITLYSPTVSRQHAALEFTNGRWTIANLSETNPVLVNDVPLLFSGTSHYIREGEHTRVLSDGDCIALGEVLLRFHAR